MKMTYAQIFNLQGPFRLECIQGLRLDGETIDVEFNRGAPSPSFSGVLQKSDATITTLSALFLDSPSLEVEVGQKQSYWGFVPLDTKQWSMGVIDPSSQWVLHFRLP
jgi:hypothetical protein